MSSAPAESDSSSPQDPKDIDAKEKDKEKEDPSEDASLDLISKCSPSLSSKKDKKISRDSLTTSNLEDLDPKDPLELENSTELKRLKMKRPYPTLVLLSRSTSLEELSRARRTLTLLKDKKLPRSKDL